MLMPQLWTVTKPWATPIHTTPKVIEEQALGGHHFAQHHSHRGSVGGGGFWLVLVWLDQLRKGLQHGT